VIAGNHDTPFDQVHYERSWQKYHHQMLDSNSVRAILTESQSVTYLEDSETSVFGLRVYGSPWQPEFCDWAFNLKRGHACTKKWQRIPEGIDVLVTHGPPAGHGDLCSGSHFRAGCNDLLNRVRKLRPRYHVFGHIHEGYGATSDGVTTFINASTCNLRYAPTNPPIVFDVSIPNGAQAAQPAAESEGTPGAGAVDGSLSPAMPTALAALAAVVSEV